MSVPSCHSLIVVPARRASTRLPDKLLLRETGKPVLQHTIERALEAAELAGDGESRRRVWVTCDDPELAAVATACGVGHVLIAQADSGTERIARSLPALPSSHSIVNLQADEPEMPAAWIADCQNACQAAGTDVATVALPLQEGDAALQDPNAVKVVVDHRGFALYFSRAPIPAVRQGGKPPSPRAWRHVGLYAYSTAFLRRYFDLPASDLEQSECLEQLRFLQAGARIRVLLKTEANVHVRGIDTEEDYRAFVARRQAEPR
jgi:3-deoxy-manno-octulosonate cytidylyltransferase (CMP-KDO synthetase)